MSIIFQKKNIQVNKPFDLVFLFLICSMLLRRECCTFSNGEYVKSGLCVLEKWIVDTEEHAGAAWDELQFIRQAVDFLVELSIIHSF